MKFSTIVLPYKKCVADKRTIRTYINRGCNLLNSYLQTDLVKISLDKSLINVEVGINVEGVQNQ
jgi:hypothetical protein